MLLVCLPTVSRRLQDLEQRSVDRLAFKCLRDRVDSVAADRCGHLDGDDQACGKREIDGGTAELLAQLAERSVAVVERDRPHHEQFG